ERRSAALPTPSKTLRRLHYRSPTLHRRGAEVAAIFPRWTNRIPLAIGVGAPVVLSGLIGAVWYWFSPSYTDVGYQPRQPVAFSHKLHAGDLGLDCRYCHSTVEESSYAAIPPTATCMNCHS